MTVYLFIAALVALYEYFLGGHTDSDCVAFAAAAGLPPILGNRVWSCIFSGLQWPVDVLVALARLVSR